MNETIDFEQLAKELSVVTNQLPTSTCQHQIEIAVDLIDRLQSALAILPADFAVHEGRLQRAFDSVRDSFLDTRAFELLAPASALLDDHFELKKNVEIALIEVSKMGNWLGIDCKNCCLLAASLSLTGLELLEPVRQTKGELNLMKAKLDSVHKHTDVWITVPLSHCNFTSKNMSEKAAKGIEVRRPEGTRGQYEIRASKLTIYIKPEFLSHYHIEMPADVT